ncbi:hypothetical protein LLH23_09815 [bacterium]|nr:hypothetical protein [bacterium]
MEANEPDPARATSLLQEAQRLHAAGQYRQAERHLDQLDDLSAGDEVRAEATPLREDLERMARAAKCSDAAEGYSGLLSIMAGVASLPVMWLLTGRNWLLTPWLAWCVRFGADFGIPCLRSGSWLYRSNWHTFNLALAAGATAVITTTLTARFTGMHWTIAAAGGLAVGLFVFRTLELHLEGICPRGTLAVKEANAERRAAEEAKRTEREAFLARMEAARVARSGREQRREPRTFVCRGCRHEVTETVTVSLFDLHPSHEHYCAACTHLMGRVDLYGERGLDATPNLRGPGVTAPPVQQPIMPARTPWQDHAEYERAMRAARRTPQQRREEHGRATRALRLLQSDMWHRPDWFGMD